MRVAWAAAVLMALAAATLASAGSTHGAAGLIRHTSLPPNPCLRLRGGFFNMPGAQTPGGAETATVCVRVRAYVCVHVCVCMHVVCVCVFFCV